MKKLIILLLLTFIFCKTKDEMMSDFVKCANDQVGKEYLEAPSSRGPLIFSNSGLIWYCRDVAGLPKASTIYVSWKKVPNPKIGAYVYGILKDTGVSVSSETLGIIVSLNPTMVVAGDPDKGVLTRHILDPKKNYLRIEYQYVDI